MLTLFGFFFTWVALRGALNMSRTEPKIPRKIAQSYFLGGTFLAIGFFVLSNPENLPYPNLYANLSLGSLIVAVLVTIFSLWPFVRLEFRKRIKIFGLAIISAMASGSFMNASDNALSVSDPKAYSEKMAQSAQQWQQRQKRKAEEEAQDAKDRAKEAEEEAKNLSTLDAIGRCQNYVTIHARFPSKVDFIGYADTSKSGYTITVRGRVELMNGMGAMIPNIYYCKFKEGKVVDFKEWEG